MPNLAVRIGTLALSNPLIAASGTYGFGEIYRPIVSTGVWGAICLKSLTPEPRSGNPGLRLFETHGGLLNSIGLANPGFEAFRRDILPELDHMNTAVIASIAGGCGDDYVRTASELSKCQSIAGLELNLSCPNVAAGGLAFGTDPRAVERVVGSVRSVVQAPLWVKLSPNVTSVAEAVRAAEDAGADAIVMGNTFLGMEIDIHHRRPVFERIYAGYSGPPIFPLALRCVHQAARATGLPVIASGGISGLADVQKMILAGASAVQLGTVNLIRPDAVLEILEGLSGWADDCGVTEISALVGKLDDQTP